MYFIMRYDPSGRGKEFIFYRFACKISQSNFYEIISHERSEYIVKKHWHLNRSIDMDNVGFGGFRRTVFGTS